MANVNDIISAVDVFIDSRIDSVIGNNALLSLAQPLIKRAAKSQFQGHVDTMKDYLKLLADKDGNIDIDTIFEEVTERFNTMDAVSVPTNSIIGDLTVGKGKLSINLPAMFGSKPRSLVFTAEDITDFKSMIIKK